MTDSPTRSIVGRGIRLTKLGAGGPPSGPSVDPDQLSDRAVALLFGEATVTVVRESRNHLAVRESEGGAL